ncbi:hypothetical protein GCM10023080_089040 [Streptomyces pseudoechinosporeus]
MMLTEGQDVDAGLLRENGLVDNLPDGLRVGHGDAGVVLRHIPERVQTEDEIRHGWAPPAVFPGRGMGGTVAIS